MKETKKYNVAIVGGGASGTALLYSLAKYTNLDSIAIIEKYKNFGEVNSKSKNNSQTLHIGDIETNYTIEKAKSVKKSALMIPEYTKTLDKEVEREVIFPVQKMILAVGKEEVEELKERYEDIKDLYPGLEKLDKDGIGKVEPEVIKDRKEDEEVLALFTKNGHAVNYGKLAQSFVKESEKIEDKTVDILNENKVLNIEKKKGYYKITTDKNIIHAEKVVVNADAYSLFFAKNLGYGKNFSLIPIAGNFYFTKEKLRGKVYTMQDKKLPFAAIHGDPDVSVPGKTRWGPTAKLKLVLEAGKLSSSGDYFKSAGLLSLKTVISFAKILSDFTRVKYLLVNALYDFPISGKKMFVKNVQKIVPSIKASDLTKAKGFGGMRLQRVDIKTGQLQLGEGKIEGENIIFNMTPSPGASVCLYNGKVDAEKVINFFDGKYTFDKEKMESDFKYNS